MKVLFPTIFEKFSFGILRELIKLRKAGLKEIVFLYVIEPEKVIVPKTGELLKSELEKEKQKAEEGFKKWQLLLEEYGIEASYHVKMGKAVEKILETAIEENADLVILGHRKRRSFFGILFSSLGSTALTFIKVTAFPVLIFPSTFKEHEKVSIFEKIIIATDLSKNSFRMIEYILKFQPLIDGITVVHVLKNGSESTEIEEKLKEITDHIKSSGVKNVSYKILRNDEPADAILNEAQNENATLIAMGIIGTHEEKRMKYNLFWFGSVAQKVTDDADIPVLLVPPEREAKTIEELIEDEE
ncbi:MULTISPECIES: universal stress protein [unclassified Desulfurobacterium]|uniref:universal stress protein n=1 Tax=unclassified Desulfurobacterium TaxID=2639089 RepID=UPI0003B57C48|nr:MULTISPECIES: universal stress protein [unclassified Desulfurobacterium]